jgi:K+-sensing histidine kinase KdpD
MSEHAREYGLAVLALALCTAACFALYPLTNLTDLVMVYMVGTLAVALRGRRGPALLSSACGVLCFDFFFVPPRFTLHVDRSEYLVTFAVMFGVALLISHLALSVKRQAEAAKRAEVVAETERLRSSLLSAVSHELRTPLAAIVGSAGALLRGRDEAGRDLLLNIRGEAERMSRLIHNLIETTRLESGAALRKEPYPIDDVVGTALERTDSLLAGRPVGLDLPENLPLAPLDPALMELVLVNLVENAVRHAPGAELSISARERMEALEVSVADRGPGLREEELERVFEKFYRGNLSAGGAGLGLAICRAVVEAHGGRIVAENRGGGGAVFRLTLPLKEAR